MSVHSIRCLECRRVAAIENDDEAFSLYWSKVGRGWMCHHCAGIEASLILAAHHRSNSA